MIRIVSFAACLVGLFAVDADACRFGRCRACRVQAFHQQAVVVQEVVPAQPATVVINNAAPSAVIQPGQSAFGYGSPEGAQVQGNDYGRLEPTDLNLAMSLGARGVYDSVGVLGDVLQGVIDIELRDADDASRRAELAVKVQALNALMDLLQPEVASTRVTVQSGSPAASLQRGAEEVIIDQVCASCHGSKLKAPKKGLVIDSTQKFDHATIGRIIEQVELGSMPPESPLSDAAAALLRKELFERRID